MFVRLTITVPALPASIEQIETPKPIIPTTETWLVLVTRGGTYVGDKLVGAEFIDLIVVDCKFPNYAEAVREQGYDFYDLNLNFTRRKITRRAAKAS